MSRTIEYISPRDLVIVGLDTTDREGHPLFDERVFLPLNEALVKNIIIYGIQHPVIVRREAGKCYVVDGRQRVRAARSASARQGDAGEHQVKVPVREVRCDDSRVSGIMVSTNELRTDDETLLKALKAVRLMDLVGDVHEVAIAFGRSTTQVRNWFSLAEADVVVHAAIRSGVVSASAAIEISRFPREEQLAAIERLSSAVGGEKVSESQAKEDRRAQGESSGTKKATATAASTTTANKASKSQVGIKRTWVRDALKTGAAKALPAEQLAVLTWFATGQSKKGTWFDTFRREAEAEMEKK